VNWFRRRLAPWLLLLAPAAGLAQDPAPPQDAEQRKDISVPFAFYNELFGFAGGYSWARDGFLQPQANLVLSGMAGTSGSGMLYLKSRNLLVPGFERLFADPMAIIGYSRGNDVYADGNPGYAAQRAGSNGSAYGNYITGNGWDNFARVTFRYLLPVGWGRDHLVDDYRLDRGILVAGASGGASPNPLDSGKTFLVARPFWASQTLRSSGVDVSQKTNGVDLMLNWDNRDFFTNPSVGQSLTLRWSRDFGAFGSTSPWTAVAAEVDQYFSLGASDWFRQQVLAFDVWTAGTPSWRARADGKIENRPPTYAGATLGGWWRMRGYRIARFSDDAAIYYSAEYRMIPRWNPFDACRWVQDRVGIQWIQLVPFAELGRVAPSWDVGELHRSMKWDLGLGLRFLARTILVRVDVGASPEGAAVQMMVEQPFQY
jgi:hypothetical protein